MSTVNAPLEGLPTTGLFQSFNGRITFGGFTIIRVERANFTISHNVDMFYEVGRREGFPYAKQFDVRGTIQRAFVNGAEWKLALGFAPLTNIPAAPGASNAVIFDPGKIYDDDMDLKTLVSLHDYDNSFNLKNVYPIKTKAGFEINTIDDIPTTPSGDPGKTPSAGYKMFGNVTGLMINTLGITIGQSGELITSGPIDWIGEMITFKVVAPGDT